MSLSHRLASLYFTQSRMQRLMNRRANGAVSVLMYHEVLPDSMRSPLWHVVAESRFRRQMTYLSSNFDVVDIDTAASSLGSQEIQAEYDRPRVVITFDDGYRGNRETAYSILDELGLPFTVFVATSAIEDGQCYWYDRVACALLDSGVRNMTLSTSRGEITYRRSTLSPSRRWAAVDRVLSEFKRLPADERESLAQEIGHGSDNLPLQMMTPAQIGELSSSNLATIGCHTHWHDLLDTIPIDDARRSITYAQELLTSWTGSTPRHFSYPNGNFNTNVVSLVTSLGFASAVTTIDRTALPDDDVYTIPRIGIGRFENENVFRARLAGKFDERRTKR